MQISPRAPPQGQVLPYDKFDGHAVTKRALAVKRPLLIRRETVIKYWIKRDDWHCLRLERLRV